VDGLLALSGMFGLNVKARRAVAEGLRHPKCTDERCAGLRGVAQELAWAYLFVALRPWSTWDEACAFADEVRRELNDFAEGVEAAKGSLLRAVPPLPPEAD